MKSKSKLLPSPPISRVHQKAHSVIFGVIPIIIICYSVGHDVCVCVCSARGHINQMPRGLEHLFWEGVVGIHFFFALYL